LPDYIERRGREILDAKSRVGEAVPYMHLMRAKGRVLPKVQFFEGEEGIKQAYEDKLENNKSKVLYEFAGMEAGYKKLDQRWINYYLNKRVRLKIRAEYIVPDTPFAREKAKLDERLFRKARFISSEHDMETEISIYDDKVSLTSFSAENPVTVIIEDGAIARTMKKLFDYIESTSK